MSEIDSYAIEEYFLNKAEEELAMTKEDRCYTVIEELERELRMLKRVNGYQEEDIATLKIIKNVQAGTIEELKKTIRLQQIQLERGIS